MRALRPTAGRTPRRGRRWISLAAAAALVLAPGAAIGSLSPSQAVTPEVVEEGADDAAAAPFRVASFNVLGHSHTAPGGNRPGWLGSGKRMKRTVGMLNRRGVGVVGFQELQKEQYAKFGRLVGDRWQVFPGDRYSHIAMHNSIAWRTDTWSMVKASTMGIPYFHGEIVPMPFIQLRHVTTGQLVWFANFHNPADGRGRGSQQKWRDIAKARQAALANKLWETGVPLIMTGDMNESKAFFCTIAAAAPMKAPGGGSVVNNRCTPPPLRGIDWILGSLDLEFSNFVMANGPFVQRTSDHPLVLADVTVQRRG